MLNTMNNGFKDRKGVWLLSNLFPLPLLLILGHSGWRGLNAPYAAAVIIAILILGVAWLQTRAMAPRRWFWRTSVGIAAALVTAAIALGAADSFGAERAGIVIGHILGGAMLVLLQSTAFPRGERLQWIVRGLAAWIIGPILLVLLPWHLAGDISPFPGYRELVSFALLLAGYGVATALTRSTWYGS